MVRITLVRPPVNVLHKFSKPVECLALGYLTSALRADNHHVTMLDGMLYDWSEEETVDRIVQSKPDIVGFTNVLNYFPSETKSQIKKLRKLFDGLIIAGGHSVSFFPERILRSVEELNLILCGEGESSIRQLAKCFESNTSYDAVDGIAFLRNGEFFKNKPKRIVNLDGVLPPARDLVPELIAQDGLICISTSRGCYARCSFCSIPRFYGLSNGKHMHSGDWLSRDVDRVISEITALHEDFGLLELLIVDDEFFGGSEVGKQRAIIFGQRLSEMNIPLKFTISCRAENVDYEVLETLKRGGLTHVFVGIESGIQEDLKLLTKGHSPNQNKQAVEIIKSLGLSFQAGFMMFNHRSTLNQLKVNLEFLRELGECKPIVINSAVDPHFGAPITKLMDREGGVSEEDTLLEAVYSDPDITLMRAVAEKCAMAFQPFMVFLAGINSAVTYEWRRKVPHRTEEEQKGIDAFEESVNKNFTQVFEDALDHLINKTFNTYEELIEFVDYRLDELNEQLKLPQALVIHSLQQGEAGIKYWSQSSMIAYTLQNKITV
jgi:anaerobic magnesium-protoporphyrin IX monomethyl ester cyclase